MTDNGMPNGNDKLPDPIETTVKQYITIPDPLREYEQWICWSYEEKTGSDGEVYETKVPYNVNKPGGRAKSDNPDTWVKFARACEYDRHHEDTDGIGFVFSEEDPFVGIDFDNVVSETDWEDWARTYIETADSYTEYSPTETGAHTIVEGSKSGDKNRTGMESTLDDYEKSDIEIYEDGQFFTVTGDHAGWTPETINERQPAIDTIYNDVFSDDEDTSESDDLSEFDGDAIDALEAEKSQPSPTQRDKEANLSDEEIRDKWGGAKNGRDISDLYNGSTAGFDSHSEARMSFLIHLAFWTGEDPRQMDRMFKDSGLYPHPTDEGKWERVRHDEIEKAIKKNSDTYTPPREREEDDDSLRSQRNDLLEKIEAKASLSKAKRPVAEERLIEGWIDANIDELTKAEANNDAKEHCSIISDVSMHFNQTEILDKIKAAISNENDADEIDGENNDSDDVETSYISDTFDAIIIDRLKRVEKITTTDHVQETVYSWEFEDGTFETSCNKTRIHFNWHNFRNEYYDETSNNALKPIPDRRDADDWRDFMIAIIHNRKEERKEIGPRTSAVYDMQSYVQKSPAYGTLEAATSRRGVYLNGDPDANNISEQPTQLWIPNTVSERIKENYGLSTSRKIQSELSARGHTIKIPGHSGTSVKENINGSNIVFWVLSPEFADPLSYTEEPMESDNDFEQNDNNSIVGGETANTGVLAEVMAEGNNE